MSPPDPCPLGVYVSTELVGVPTVFVNLELLDASPGFVGDVVGVCRSVEGEDGDSGRRKGELRWEP